MATLRQFHTLASRLGMSDEVKKNYLLDAYKVESSKDLTAAQLQEACQSMAAELREKNKVLDQRRKYALGAAAAWFKLNGYTCEIEKLKRAICRAAAAKTDNINDLSISQLNTAREVFNKHIDAKRKADKENV